MEYSGGAAGHGDERHAWRGGKALSGQVRIATAQPGPRQCGPAPVRLCGPRPGLFSGWAEMLVDTAESAGTRKQKGL